MKVKFVSKKKVNEVLEIIALGAILLAALGVFYKSIVDSIKQLDSKLGNADRKIRAALTELPPEIRKNAEEEYNKLLTDLRSEATRLQEISKDANKANIQKETPSKIMADKLQSISDFVANLKGEDVKAGKKLQDIEADIQKICDSVRDLDLLLLLTSKNVNNSLYQKINSSDLESLKNAVQEPKNLFALGNILYSTRDAKASTAKGVKVSDLLSKTEKTTNKQGN